ncbi:MAG: hypothetical protein GWM90_32985, partial [Gemmatimonadetes bacterium]|nr:hypothetical protein [Gemmatimonadota bacterium]NIR42164.1 hypothetical protein [Actinomycetota bacterium]NIU80341.1 hypothetical protein [Gammaproteobacteria bacterium]NIQ60127.1 hypothetical protein [Gemmatimonadota bacterium]NIX48700.1 hypothetical protein [Gemmatimonadota bacterium]
VELWDAEGRRLLQGGDSLAPFDPRHAGLLIGWLAGGDTAVVGPFSLVADTVFYAAAAPVVDRGETLGFVVERRRIRGNADSRRQLRELIGP